MNVRVLILIVSLFFVETGIVKIPVNNSINYNRSVRKHDPKKGLCITTGSKGWVQKLERLNVSWHYSWGVKLKKMNPGMLILFR